MSAKIKKKFKLIVSVALEHLNISNTQALIFPDHGFSSRHAQEGKSILRPQSHSFRMNFTYIELL